ncbi:MAG: hypothetical protein WB586_18935 [Chthoniobacterales bacterium]
MSNPYEGDSLTTIPAGLTGRNTATSGNGIGVLGTSTNGEGVHGETNSTQFAAVAGIELNPDSNIAAVYGEQRGNGPGLYGIAKGNGWGVFGGSASGEGVHGETNSTQFAAVAGIELNPRSTIAAVYGEQRGNGPGLYGIAKGNGAGVFGGSASGEGIHGETNSTQFAAVAGIELNPSSNIALFMASSGVMVPDYTASPKATALASLVAPPTAKGYTARPTRRNSLPLRVSN